MLRDESDFEIVVPKGLGLFDQPRICHTASESASTSAGLTPPPSATQRIKISYESNHLNSVMITNPQAIFKFIKIQNFLKFSKAQQEDILTQLTAIIDESQNNGLILGDLSSSSNSRQNQSALLSLKKGVIPSFDTDQAFGSPQDILFQLLLIGLVTKNKQIGLILRGLNSSANTFQKVHFELVYQYVRIHGHDLLEYAQTSLLQSMIESSTPSPVNSYFFFNGYLSGILLNSKVVQAWPFNKGFAACMWFKISKLSTALQDPRNLPVLFNCFSSGYGGFECYFNQTKLLYRILPPTAYVPPTTDSNGVLISDFQPEKWNYIGIEHDKPFLARAQLIAVVNDKQVLNFSMDYPKFEKQSKLYMVSLCNNFIGQMSSFILFKEQINNPQKFVQIYKQHAADLTSLNATVFEQKLQDKLLLMYSAHRYNGKTVYDWIDMNDGELLINCGAQINKRKPYLQESGGLLSLLPLLEHCQTATDTNQFLKLVLLSVGNTCDPACETDFNAFFIILFSLLQALPYSAVDVKTVHLLTELRFTIQDKVLNESFFRNLIMSADFWINTSKFSGQGTGDKDSEVRSYEVMCEYWSFVKAIYSQNPVQYNTIFPIHNLIDLMKRIADINQKYCCDYHKRTQQMFYGSIGGVKLKTTEDDDQIADEGLEIEVDKYLEPICGVLETVLTTAGDEILLEIEHLAKSLCLKSCACFHLQMLKLLKVLLLDSKSNNTDCASPVDFAQKFLDKKGLQILLYLCSNNAMMDVKAMCIKLIDVLSSQTQLIQMRIDTDLITYLEHVILPKEMMRFVEFQENNRRSNSLLEQQHQTETEQITYQVIHEDELQSPPQKQEGLQFFSYEAVQEENENQQSFEEPLQNEKIFSKTSDVIRNSRPLQCESEESDEEYHTVGPGVPVAPKATSKTGDSKGFSFGFGMADDDSDEEANEDNPDEVIEEENESEEDLEQAIQEQAKIAKPKGLKLTFSDEEDQQVFKAPPSRAEHQKRFGDQILGDYNSDEEQKGDQNDEEAPKPTQDVLMSRNLRGGVGKGFNFNMAASESEESSEEKDFQLEKKPQQMFKPPPMGVRNKQPPTLGGRKFGQGFGGGLKLQINDDDASEEEADSPVLPPPPKKTPPPPNKARGKMVLDIEPPPAPKQKSLTMILSNSNDSDDNFAGATGATNDIELDKPHSKKVAAAKPGFKLAIDIDKINEIFTYGGEQGNLIEGEMSLKLETDIKELAQNCVDYMRSHKSKKSPQKTQFEKLLERPAKGDTFNKPQTVKGIKNLDIEGGQKKQSLSLTGISEDENSLAHTANQQPLEIQFQMLQQQTQFFLPESSASSQIDDYTNELENLYTSCLEWILNRAPSSLYKTLMIDDYDKIMFQPAMQILMILVTYSNNMVRQRALQDMFMLAQWDSQNGQVILQHQAFHTWLLELLMPYQSCNQRQSESQKALFDMGTKLHTLLLKNACSNTEEDDGFKKVNLLTRWPAVAKEKGHNVNTAHALVRTLTTSLVNALGQQLTQNNSTLKQSPILRNLVHISLQVYELVLSSHETSTDEKDDDAIKRGEMNESLLQWVQRQQYLKYIKEQGKSVWAEWPVLTSLAKCWDALFIGQQVTGEADENDLLETLRSILLSKNQDQLQDSIDVLMVGFCTTTSPAHQQTRLQMLTNFGRAGGTAEKGKLSDAHVKDGVHTLQAISVLVCLALTQAEREKQLTKLWLNRLEVYFKHALLLAELWKGGKNDSIFSEIQRKIAETCSFMLAFMFQEVHTTQTPKAQTQPDNEISSSSNSDKNLQTNKHFAQCLKRCLIFLVTLIDLKNDNQHTTASQIILEQILIKQYRNSNKPLINCANDIAHLIESNFDEFPECFQQNDWKIAFFHNQIIKQVTKQQLNLQILNQFKTKRDQYAARFQESEVNTNQAKEEILKKIQAETLQAISELTQQEHENKNDHSFLLDVQQRTRVRQMLKWRDGVQGLRGMWSVQPEKVFQQMTSSVIGEGQKCLLKDRATNQFNFIQDRSLETNIFKKVYQPTAATFIEIRANYLSRNLSTIQKDELQPRYKEILIDQLLAQMKPTRKKIIQSDDVELLKPLEKKQGSIVMTNFELIFVFDLVQSVDKDKNIFFFQWQLKDSDRIYKTISLGDLKEIQKRRFLGQNKALELFLMSGKSIILNFKDAETRDQFAKKILRQRQNKCRNLKYYTSLDHKWILKKKMLTEEWINWRISNFDYLMQLNQLAGRSFNDLSQYPVFPWVLANFSGAQIPDLTATSIRGSAAPAQFRDLSKNMQLLGSAERQAEFKRKYEDQEGFIGIDDRFHCGSHYSNPGIVLHYMSRIQPILEANVVLQGKSMDNPDRIFQSLEHSFKNSLNDFSDVRELTPEFFCMPEMFTNLNEINFGFKQDGTKVDDVKLPEWCNKNPQLFVQVMREVLESQYVSSNLNSWIDYIFGSKQRDQEAVLCLNTFSKITYQADLPGDMDITTIQDPILRSAIENQAYNFGQTPLQLFKDRHAAKLPYLQALKSNLIVDEISKLKIFKPVPVGANQKVQQIQISPEAILYAKFDDEQRIVGAQKQGYLQSFVWIPKAHDSNPQTPFSLGSDKKSKFNGRERENAVDMIDRSIRRFDYPMTIMNNGGHVCKGGFWDGKIAFCPVEGTNSTGFELIGHKTTVSSLVCDKKEHTIISGSKSGEVIVWRNSNFDCSVESCSSANPWVNMKQVDDHQRQITSIFINDEMNLFVTGSLDGTANMYNLWTAKRLRTFSHPILFPIQNVVLAQTPTALCAIYSREDHMWNVFSVNGQNLCEPESAKVGYEDCSHVIQPIVIKAVNSFDKLVYGTERGYIIMRHLPSMVKYRKLQVSKDFPVLTLITSPDRRFLLVGCGDGGLIVTTERGEQQQQAQPNSSAGYRSQRGSFNEQREQAKSANWMTPLTSLVSRQTPQNRNN